MISRERGQRLAQRTLIGTLVINLCEESQGHVEHAIFLAMAEDNRTFCLAGGLSKADPFRPAFRNGNVFDLMAALPGKQTWVSVGTPITEVQLMGGLANRRRSLLSMASRPSTAICS